MKEMFFEVYRRYAGYHSQKDQLVWVPVAAYLVFVGSVMGWLGAHPGVLACHSRCLFISFLSVIWLLMVIFLCIQNKYKVDAAIIMDELDKLIPLFEKGKNLIATDLVDAINAPKNLCCCQRIRQTRKNGKPGIILIILTIVLGVAQALFVIFIDP